MKKLPKNLIEKQESERAATVTAVTDAIIMLNSQGYGTRIKDIISVTGLSRSVFAKPHIRRVLVEYGVVEPCGDAGTLTMRNKTPRSTDMIIAEKMVTSTGFCLRMSSCEKRLNSCAAKCIF